MGTCGCFGRASEEGRGGSPPPAEIPPPELVVGRDGGASARLGSTRPSSMYLSALNKPTLDLFSFFFFSPNFFLFPPHLIFR